MVTYYQYFRRKVFSCSLKTQESLMLWFPIQTLQNILLPLSLIILRNLLDNFFHLSNPSSDAWWPSTTLGMGLVVIINHTKAHQEAKKPYLDLFIGVLFNTEEATKYNSLNSMKFSHFSILKRSKKILWSPLIMSLACVVSGWNWLIWQFMVL